MSSIKVYILRGTCSTFAVAELLETEKLYLVPRDSSPEMDIYPKDIFKLEIVEATRARAESLGFSRRAARTRTNDKK